MEDESLGFKIVIGVLAGLLVIAVGALGFGVWKYMELQQNYEQLNMEYAKLKLAQKAPPPEPVVIDKTDDSLALKLKNQEIQALLRKIAQLEAELAALRKRPAKIDTSPEKEKLLNAKAVELKDKEEALNLKEKELNRKEADLNTFEKKLRSASGEAADGD